MTKATQKPNGLLLCKILMLVCRAEYDPDQFLWEKEFTLAGKEYKRQDLEASMGHRLLKLLFLQKSNTACICNLYFIVFLNFVDSTMIFAVKKFKRPCPAVQSLRSFNFS